MHFLKRLVKPPRGGATFRTRHSRPSRNGSRSGRYQSPHADLHPPSASKVPVEVLMTIFSFICPRALDETYLSAEESAMELGCMLFDMRELSHWSLLLRYRSIQLDDENEAMATLTEFLKIPYMARETYKQDLARPVSLSPNLSWVGGSGGVFNLWIEPPWLYLQVVDLTDMGVENQDLVRMLSSIPYLTNLKMKSTPRTTDAVSNPTTTNAGLSLALQTFAIQGIPFITIDRTLERLTITNTPIPVHFLHQILPLATHLISLSIRPQVLRTISHQGVPLLASRTYVCEPAFHARVQNGKASAGGFAATEHLGWTKYSVGGVGGDLPDRAKLPAIPGDAEECTPGRRAKRKSRVDLWR
ncbi:hypothetical protein C7212DRAFT_360368 [Tuber magnatum]|uniref:F-box domain-containing protein n=1 Tax=Tuber magnatum TaxID=42249 RepID=A0A317SED3_9PEZI|nr:hypothetical protein C7212DRAFT_360368 [Tuber magnatum]